MMAGIDICIKTLIPALFPFFVISGMISGGIVGLDLRIVRVIERICAMPAGTGGLLAMGLLAGYPVGARNVADALHRGDITSDSARKMAVFCNNAGPAFIFGVLGPVFPDVRWTAFLWMAQILGAVLTGYILPGPKDGQAVIPAKNNTNISVVMNQSIKSMAVVCSWVMFFRMLLEFMEKWFLGFVDGPVGVILTGLLELSNGCIRINVIQSDSLRFLLCSLLLSAGGCCIWMQTKGVFPELDMRYYLTGKWTQCLISFCISCSLLPLLAGFGNDLIPAVIGLTGLVCLISAGIRKKK